MKTAIVFMADGLEMCEGLLMVDILRRAGVNVITASIMGRKDIVSSHKVTIMADALAEEVDFDSADMLVLPGGRVGTAHLLENAIVRAKCPEFAAAGKFIAAVCAAPSVFADLGLLEGIPATAHPAFEPEMRGARLTHAPVTVSDKIITGRGLGASLEFALELAAALAGKDEAVRIAGSICAPVPESMGER
jgi:4-methyl-5(b-hydroxyethyl)-thiazole monophosphate biosynthesis